MKTRALIVIIAVLAIVGLAAGLQSNGPHASIPRSTVSPAPAKPRLDPAAPYPAEYADAPQDTVMDDWGMWNRECVSYTAFKVATTYGYDVFGWYDANYWPDTAASKGVPTGWEPRPGAVGIFKNADHGHSVWVDAVNSDGTVTVSQYNRERTGEFSVTREPANTFVYIYFGGIKQ